MLAVIGSVFCSDSSIVVDISRSAELGRHRLDVAIFASLVSDLQSTSACNFAILKVFHFCCSCQIFGSLSLTA
jgi:hypothetical protein